VLFLFSGLAILFYDDVVLVTKDDSGFDRIVAAGSFLLNALA